MRRRGPGLVGTMARTAVVAGTATAVSGNVARRQQGRANEAAAEQQAQQGPPMDDMTAQLLNLNELKNAGVLTEEEFAAAKAKLLAG